MLFDPVEYADRYNKPMVEVFLDILNATNGTKYVADDLVIGEPVPVSGLEVAVALNHVNEPLGTPSVYINYERYSLNVAFENVGVVVDIPDPTVEAILAALSDQYRIYFDIDHVEVVVDELNRIASITARPTHLMFAGDLTVRLVPMAEFLGVPLKTRIKVHEYYAQQTGKLPIEWLYDPAIDLNDYVATVSKLRPGDVLPADAPIVEALAKVSGLDLVSVQDVVARFNLYGATVLYNGFNTGTHYTGQARYANVFVLQISPHWCENLSGVWKIPYTNPDTYRYSNFSVSNPPLLY